MTTENKNYSDQMVKDIVAQYKENPTMDTVNNLATTTGKTTRSLIAKLSREGVYQKKERATKSGGAVITKTEIVQKIAEKSGLEFDMISTLVKATKTDLQKLVNTFS